MKIRGQYHSREETREMMCSSWMAAAGMSVTPWLSLLTFGGLGLISQDRHRPTKDCHPRHPSHDTVTDDFLSEAGTAIFAFCLEGADVMSGKAPPESSRLGSSLEGGDDERSRGSLKLLAATSGLATGGPVGPASQSPRGDMGDVALPALWWALASIDS
ncbi:hypothetical protein C0Q70_11920 [Pomacea canaliculata]|uniref:Uncharacterized protein n=1 Tax=Pomacea canaliculata TaxID=400727 RepID=A0A2T7P7E4_POMCA|nr:hypothetical protein C0Q70_11920 [Pomacea canaliculata]